MNTFLSPEDVTAVLQSQLKEGEVVFANGQQANNHLDLGFNETAVTHRYAIVRALAALIISADLTNDLIVPVPTGAEGWVEHYNSFAKNPQKILYLEKVARRQFALKGSEAEGSQLQRRAFVIDDATSDGGTSEAAADCIVESGFAVSAVISLFVRGEKLAPSKYRRLWITHQAIPGQLDWKEFRQSGVITST